MTRGVVLMLTGPDGAGKTSLYLSLKERFDEHGVDFFWARASVLPRKARDTGTQQMDPHGHEAYTRRASILKVLYVFVDTVVGWFIRVAPLRRRGRFVVIERGWWDMAVDPHRYRIQGVDGVVRGLGRMIPRPDLAVVLAGSPETVSSRKEDLPLEELRRQMSLWPDVLPRRVDRLLIDPALPADQIFHRVERRVAELLEPTH